MNTDIRVEDYIRAVPNFPKEGILFRDISPLLASPKAFAETTRLLTEAIAHFKPDVIAGIESRGFIFGVPVAQLLGLPFIPIRKPGKLPCDTVSVAYELEYGSDSLEMHRDAVEPGQRVVIIDDLLATGGTAAAAVSLVESQGSIAAGLGVVIELEGLAGRQRLEQDRCVSLLKF
jgi:adenine phosphoribosyltransferase